MQNNAVMKNYIAKSIPKTALYQKFSELKVFFCNSHVTKKEQRGDDFAFRPCRYSKFMPNRNMKAHLWREIWHKIRPFQNQELLLLKVL